MKYIAFITDPTVGQLQMTVGVGAVTVWSDLNPPVRTGLLDQHGTPLYRMPTTHPVGFIIGGRKA